MGNDWMNPLQTSAYLRFDDGEPFDYIGELWQMGWPEKNELTEVPREIEFRTRDGQVFTFTRT